MSMLKYIDDHKYWLKFLEYKNSKYVSKKEYKELYTFINNKEYRNITSLMKVKKYQFNIPKKGLINKRYSNKKRIIYKFSKEENIVLKYITYLLNNNYDIFSDNCYSFKRGMNPSKVLNKIIKYDIQNMYLYKVDISNYFNSVDITCLIPMIKQVLDKEDAKILIDILNNKNILYKGKIIEEEKGIMAGVPISSFLANLYLTGLDKMFNDTVYARYADDIIVGAKSIDELNQYIGIIKNELSKLHLKVNDNKEYIYNPGDMWTFLGFSYYNHIIDVSPNTKLKLKRKIRRKARALRRWCNRKNLDYHCGAISLNRIFNNKFYGGRKDCELNWSVWYFPVINTSESLKEIDRYYQDKLRYIITGKYNKSNLKKVSYEELKKLEYIPLVSRYYDFKNKKK